MTNIAEKLHKEEIVIDTTCPLASRGNFFEKWITGGATVIAPTVAEPNDSVAVTMSKLSVWFKRIREHSDKLLHVTTVEDIYRAKKENKLGVIYAFQNTDHFDNDLNLIEVYQRLGIRMVQLCYNVKNHVGDGCTERTDGGLSGFGLKAIAEMNRVGIVVDLSHTGYKTTMEAIEASQKPVIFSHSNVKSVCSSPRNICDDQIKAVAAKGGVIGIVGYPSFVADKLRPSLNDYLEHVDYIAKLVGTEYISIGIDYDEATHGILSHDEATAIYNGFVEAGMYDPKVYPAPPWYFPEGIEAPDKLPNLTAGLINRGYSEEDVKNILGKNLIRVFKEVWGCQA